MVVNLKLLELSGVAVEGDLHVESLVGVDGSGARAGDLTDDVVGKSLKSSLGVSALVGSSSRGSDRRGGVVLSEDIVELKSVGSRKSAGSRSLNTDRGGGNTSRGIISVKGVDTVLATAEGAVSAVVPGVAGASHGNISVPKGVDVSELGRGEVADGLAGTMSTAGIGAGGTLASSTIVTIKALALSSLAVAETLVGALHVVVSGVGKDGSSSSKVNRHRRVLLLSSVGVDGRRGDHSAGGDGVTVVKISLGSIDVGKSERTGPCNKKRFFLKG